MRKYFRFNEIKQKIISGGILLVILAIFLSLFLFLSQKLEVSLALDDASLLRKEVTFWKKPIKDLGPKEAYDEFLRLAGTKPLDPHDQAHAFGEALYAEEGLSGLEYCALLLSSDIIIVSLASVIDNK